MTATPSHPLDRLRHHVSGAVDRGEKEALAEIPVPAAILHLDAGHDRNGNPRRVYVGIDATGTAVAVTDEGYAGEPGWVRSARSLGIEAVRIPTTASYRRDVLREARALGVVR